MDQIALQQYGADLQADAGRTLPYLKREIDPINLVGDPKEHLILACR